MQSNVKTTLQMVTGWLSKRHLKKGQGGGEWKYGMELWLLTQVKPTEIALIVFAQICSSLYCL